MKDAVRSGFLKLIKLDFIRFCIVGGAGFLINLLLLVILHNVLGVKVLYAQFIAAEVALFSNFMLHHHWTYSNRKVDKTMKKLILQFHATTWPAIIGSSLMVAGGVTILKLSEIVALILSSLVALFWNFAWSKYVVWKDVTTQQIEQIADK